MAMLCAEVRRIREDVRAIIDRAHDKDLRVVLVELHRLTQGVPIFERSPEPYPGADHNQRLYPGDFPDDVAPDSWYEAEGDS